jgi:hypothetical protein
MKVSIHTVLAEGESRMRFINFRSGDAETIVRIRATPDMTDPLPFAIKSGK